jgi:hypothetical protein
LQTVDFRYYDLENGKTKLEDLSAINDSIRIIFLDKEFLKYLRICFKWNFLSDGFKLIYENILKKLSINKNIFSDFVNKKIDIIEDENFILDLSLYFQTIYFEPIKLKYNTISYEIHDTSGKNFKVKFFF